MTRRSEQISLHLNAYLTAHSTPPDAILRELATETADRYPNEISLQVAPELGTFLTLLTRVGRARSGSKWGLSPGTRPSASRGGSARAGGCCAATSARSGPRSPGSTGRRPGSPTGSSCASGRALDTLRALPEEEAFDVAFIDADKLSYPQYWAEVVPRVRGGGVIMVDNTFSHGRVLDAGNDNPSVIAVRTMNDQAAADERVELIMLPIGDGLTVALQALGGS